MLEERARLGRGTGPRDGDAAKDSIRDVVQRGKEVVEGTRERIVGGGGGEK